MAISRTNALQRALADDRLNSAEWDEVSALVEAMPKKAGPEARGLLGIFASSHAAT